MWNTRHPLAFARQPHHHPRSLAPTGARARERGQAHMSESRPACTAGTTIRHRSLKPIAVSATPFTDGRLDQRNWVRGMDSLSMTGSHRGVIFRRERISFLLLRDPKSSIRAIYTSSAHIVPLSSWIYRVPAHRLLEWSYGLRSAKLCALWMAQAFICSNSLAPVLRISFPS